MSQQVGGKILGIIQIFLLVVLASGSIHASVILDIGNRGTPLVVSDKDHPYGISVHVNTSFKIQYAGNEYNGIGVSSDGLIYFGPERALQLPDDLTAGSDLAAVFPLLQRNKLVEGSSVTYLEISNDRTDELVQELDNVLVDFRAGSFIEWIFVVTWSEVRKAKNAPAPKKNTFQVVLAGTGEKTFVVFNYAKLFWTKSNFQSGVSFNAQAGFFDGKSNTDFYLPDSGKSEIKLLQFSSNVMVNGRWIYDVTHFLPVEGGGVPCDIHPCHNGGICEHAQCKCLPGYAGIICEDKLSFVRCDSTSMTVVLDERLLPMNSNLEEIHLNSWSEGCTARVFDNYHLELSTRFDNCGTTLREDEDNIIFRNLITFEKPGAKDSGAVITREYHKQIQVECCLSKASILAGQFQPKISKIDIEDKELGMFSLRIARFTDFSFDVEKSVGDEGVVAEDRVMLGSEICFGVVLDSTPIVGVVIKSCWATEGGPEDVPPREDLINDQCPAEQSVRVNHMVSRDIEGFCFSAFRFRDEESDMSQVFIHCDVTVCGTEEADAARSDVSCAGQGGGGRRRRDASSGSSQHTISYGPLSIFSQGNGFAASVQDSRGMFSRRMFVGGIVALVSMVIIWGVVKGCGYKTKGPKNERAYLIDVN